MTFKCLFQPKPFYDSIRWGESRFLPKKGVAILIFFPLTWATGWGAGEGKEKKKPKQHTKTLKNYSSAQVRLHLQNLHGSNSREALAATQTWLGPCSSNQLQDAAGSAANAVPGRSEAAVAVMDDSPTAATGTARGVSERQEKGSGEGRDEKGDSG